MKTRLLRRRVERKGRKGRNAQRMKTEALRDGHSEEPRLGFREKRKSLRADRDHQQMMFQH